jgi:hypothetical protein
MFLALSTELLRDGYSVRFLPKGHSMHPTIRDREAVTVEPASAHSLKRGDILFYETARGVIAHRVVEIQTNENADRIFVVRGDAANSSAERVEARQILGRVISVERDGRNVALIGKCARLRRAARVCATHLKLSLRLQARRASL